MTFHQFKDSFSGLSALIVGKGPTTWDFATEGAKWGGSCPVFFINDAIGLASHFPDVRHKFLFFQDQAQAKHWLRTPMPGVVMVTRDEWRAFDKAGNQVLFWTYREPDSRVFKPRTRAQLAEHPLLYLGEGTISPLLHFAWFCGIRDVSLVGCDGLNDKAKVRLLTGGKDYNPAIPLPTGGRCDWKYDRIRASQDALIETFGIDAHYLGTPAAPAMRAGDVVFCTMMPKGRALDAPAGCKAMSTAAEHALNISVWPRFDSIPEIIAEAREQHPGKAVVFVHPNTEFVGTPSGFSELEDCDIALYECGNTVKTGLVYVSAGERGRNITDEWLLDARRQRNKSPAEVLANVLYRNRMDHDAVVHYKVGRLPAGLLEAIRLPDSECFPAPVLKPAVLTNLPLFCSFATPNYAARLAKLVSSGRQFGVTVEPKFEVSAGSWARNCAIKPRFIREFWKAHGGRAVVWVDADAEFVAAPTHFCDMPADVDVAFASRGTELLSGTLYFGGTQGALRLLDAWCEEQEKHPTEWDQRTLSKVIERGQYVVQPLPAEYAYIHDITANEHPGIAPVIVHWQASRTEKGK